MKEYEEEYADYLDVPRVNPDQENEQWLKERGFQLIHREDVEHWQFDLIKNGFVVHEYVDMIRRQALMWAKTFVEKGEGASSI